MKNEGIISIIGIKKMSKILIVRKRKMKPVDMIKNLNMREITTDCEYNNSRTILLYFLEVPS